MALVNEVTCSKFLFTDKGQLTKLYRITNKSGAYVEISDLGASIVSIVVPDKDGNLVDVCLSYSTYKGFKEGEEYFGGTIGRHAGRIARGKFTLNGKKYQLPVNNGFNHLHGGPDGFSRRVWSSYIKLGKVYMSLVSPDGDQGYPGEVKVTVIFSFDDENNLNIDYQATTSNDTILNLTNHVYFNLNGEGNSSILDNYLYINADRYIPIDHTLIPLSLPKSVYHTPFDFRRFKQIGQDITSPSVQIGRAIGYDHSFVIKSNPAAIAYSLKTGIKLTVKTTCPILHFYSGNYINLSPDETKSHTPYPYRCGFALETQGYNDAINHPQYPQNTLHKGEIYHASTTYTFSLI